MQVFEMVVAIVAIAIIGGIIEKHLKLKAKTTAVDEDLKREIDRLRAEHQGVEERLRVLEAIVSSDGYDLKQRFKDLER